MVQPYLKSDVSRNKKVEDLHFVIVIFVARAAIFMPLIVLTYVPVSGI